MIKLIIIDETVPFTQEDFDKATERTKKNDATYQAPQEAEWYAKGQVTSSAIYDWYMQHKMIKDNYAK